MAASERIANQETSGVCIKVPVTKNAANSQTKQRDLLASILARFNKARAACLTAQTDASRQPDSTKRTVTWFAGLSESAVPVYVGDHILGFLETGEVMLKNPTKKHFASIT